MMTKGVSIKIEPKHWDADHNRVRKSFPFYRQINTKLDEIEEQIEAICYRVMARGAEPNPRRVKSLYLEAGETASPIEAFRAFIKRKAKTTTNLKKHNATLSRLIEIGDIDWMDFTEDFPERFTRDTWHRNTLSQYLDLIVEFLEWSSIKQWYSGKDHLLWDTKIIKYKKSVLELDEIATIINMNISPTLEPGRDLLIWCIFSGMRFGETLSENILQGEYLLFKREKGVVNQYHRIKMNSILSELWDKYGSAPRISDNTVNKDYENSKANTMIREVCRLAGLTDLVEVRQGLLPKWQTITTHTGRRTFTTMARRVGISSAEIGRVLDHANTATTEGYDQSGAEMGYKVMDEIETKIITMLRTG